MNSAQIRQLYLDFFKSKEHEIVKSAPLVVKDDPTLMFTNAGMNQFKDVFLGHRDPVSKRVADTQKCLRVSGKHNDLEEVGIDTYHHTMFEMLGNWSFGDYFKKEAILWAWELLTEVYKLPAERMYVSVFGGDKPDGLEIDNEAFSYWKSILPEDRILYGSKKDNFWEMGETGPCGPCSEIHIDLRTEEDIKKIPGRELVNNDHPLVVEIWNLVFIQYNRLSNGELENLPNKHIDTGMGFERLAMAIQGKKSNYDTDVFQPLIQTIAKKANVKYGENKKNDVAIRVISDHVRAVSFTIADGQLPSNNKAGYVIRRILRRAVRYGFTFLNFSEPFIFELVDVLIDQFKTVFPEIFEQKEFIKKVIYEEEASFLRTLENGLRRFEQIKKQLPSGVEKLDGKIVFELYDTFGFPVDLTALIARENSLTIDEEGFTLEMNKQKERSKKAARQDAGDWVVINEIDHVDFVGYDSLTAMASIARYREIKSKDAVLFQLVLNKTPFYAESGGQVGDRGYIQSNGDRVYIIDTKKENDLIIHYAKKLPENLNAEYECFVDEKKRKLTENNHSGTHLLHAALKQVLGDHVQQRGSFVNEEILRFDFSHFSKLTSEEIKQVEHVVNAKIRQNIILDEKQNVPIEKAKEMGANALFGEKYGDFVRVITFDKDYSVEFCGGTHVPSTGNIGLFKILTESSIAAGVRRIEAITAEKAEDFVDEKIDLINSLGEYLKYPKDIRKTVEKLVSDRNQLQKEIEKLQQDKGKSLKDALLKKVEKSDDFNRLIEKVSVPDAGLLKDLAFQLKNQLDNLFMVLVADIKGKPLITVVISENLVQAKNLHAGNIVKDLAREINGGGGGQPFYATAGGSSIDGIDKVITKAANLANSINK